MKQPDEFSGTSRKKETVFGETYTEHTDEEGEVTGVSKDNATLLGEQYVEHRDADGNLVGRSHERETVFGDRYTEQTDRDGNKAGESRQRTSLLEEPATEHLDQDGKKVGESRAMDSVFSGAHAEHRGRYFPATASGGSDASGSASSEGGLVVGGIALFVGIIVLSTALFVAPFVLLLLGFVGTLGAIQQLHLQKTNPERFQTQRWLLRRRKKDSPHAPRRLWKWPKRLGLIVGIFFLLVSIPQFGNALTIAQPAGAVIGKLFLGLIFLVDGIFLIWAGIHFKAAYNRARQADVTAANQATPPGLTPPAPG